MGKPAHSARNALLSYEDVMEVEDISRCTLYRRIKRGEYETYRTGETLPNGRPEKKIPACCLKTDPPEPRGEEPEAAEELPAEAEDTPLPDHIPTLENGMPDTEAMKVMGMDGHVREFHKRSVAVARVEKYLRETGAQTRGEARGMVATEADVSRRTVRRWEKRKEKWGWRGLMPNWGRGRRTYRKIPLELQNHIIDGWCWQGVRSKRQIYRDIVEPYFEERGEEPPHPRTVERFIEREVPDVVTDVAREGKRAYQEKHEPRVERELPRTANEWWSSDNRQADTMVRVADGKGQGWPAGVKNEPCPCGSGEKRKDCCSVRRPWWCMTVDVASAAIVGLKVVLQPDATDICEMLQDAVLRCGVPEHWQRDNGMDYQANRLGEAGPPREGGDGWQAWNWKQLGVTVHDTIPYSSWSKYPESAFSAFKKRIENRLPGWTGNSPDNRPEKLESELEDGELLTLEAYRECVEMAWTEWNTERPVGDRERPPAEYWEDIEPEVPAPSALAFLFQRRGERKVRKGRVRIDGQSYSSRELALYSGQTLHVRWVGKEPGNVMAWAPDSEEWIWVPRLEKGSYGEFGEAHERVKEIGRAQRQYIREFAEKVKGTCPKERMDPFGAHAAVRDEQRKRRAQAEARDRALEELEEERRKQLDATEDDTEQKETNELPDDIYREYAKEMAS